MDNKVKNVERIFNYCRTINHKEDIIKYVEEPLIEICEYLYDLNILTTMSSANTKQHQNYSYIIIDFNSLSDHNKNELLNKMHKNPLSVRLGVFSVIQTGQEIEIRMSINDDTKIQDIKDFYMEMFKNLKIQEIDSFIDGDTCLKNIYSFDEMIGLYLYLKRDMYASKNDINYIAEIDEFLEDLKFNKISSKEFAGGVHAKYCEYIYFINSQIWIPDVMIYDSILKNKNKLFNNKSIKKENININEVLKFMNDLSSKIYGEQFFYNEEDKRFYLNHELLEKHNNYLKASEYSKEKAPVKTLGTKPNKDRK